MVIRLASLTEPAGAGHTKRMATRTDIPRLGIAGGVGGGLIGGLMSGIGMDLGVNEEARTRSGEMPDSH